MIRALLLVAMLLRPAFTGAGNGTEYVGLVFPPAPPGYVEHGGGVAKGNASSEELSYLSVEIYGQKMVWLTREVGRVRETPKDAWPIDRPVWRVEDVLSYPLLRRGESIHWGNDIECYFNSQLDTSIIAAGKWVWRTKTVGGYVHRVRLAWRLDAAAGKFESIPPRQVRCELNEDRD